MISQELDTVDTVGIAALLGVSLEYVKNELVCMEGFPEPLTSYPQRQWDRVEVFRSIRAARLHAHAVGAIDAQSDRQVALFVMAIFATEPTMGSGVYLLLGHQNDVLYVGKASNVLARMAGHVSKQVWRVRMIPVQDPAERTRLEVELINLLKPRLNIADKRLSDPEAT